MLSVNPVNGVVELDLALLTATRTFVYEYEHTHSVAENTQACNYSLHNYRSYYDPSSVAKFVSVLYRSSSEQSGPSFEESIHVSVYRPMLKVTSTSDLRFLFCRNSTFKPSLLCRVVRALAG